MQFGFMPSLARAVAVGFAHHINQRGNNHQDVFFLDDDRLVYPKYRQSLRAACTCATCTGDAGTGAKRCSKKIFSQESLEERHRQSCDRANCWRRAHF